MLVRYVKAYQEVQPLTIGELWAVSITLRIVLVENLAASGSRSRKAARRALSPTASPTVCSGPGTTGRFRAAVLPPMSARRFLDALAVQLVHRLRDQDPRSRRR